MIMAKKPAFFGRLSTRKKAGNSRDPITDYGFSDAISIRIFSVLELIHPDHKNTGFLGDKGVAKGNFS